MTTTTDLLRRAAELLRGYVNTYEQVSEDEPGGYCSDEDAEMDGVAASLLALADQMERADPVACSCELEGFKHGDEHKPLYTAPQPSQGPEGWRHAVALAYAHLWHVNNEPMAPIPIRSNETAAYAARKLLRDLLTKDERGQAINEVNAMLSAALKESK